MNIDNAAIRKILLDQHYVTEEDIKKAEGYAVQHRGSFLEYLLSEEIISNAILGQAMAEFYKTPYADLAAQPPVNENISLIPEAVAKKFRVIALKVGKDVVVATDNPEQEGLPDAMAAVFPAKKIKISFALPIYIDDVLLRYQKTLDTQFAELIKSQGKLVPEIVDQIIDDAFTLHASDIHIEPQERSVLVRFRIDGVLHDAGVIPLDYHGNIVNRIKIQAQLRIDEHFGAQDGAIRFLSKRGGDPVDLRVSIVPTVDGEKVAIRILSSYVRNLTLSDIGLSEDLQKRIAESARKPFGMILVTGPTGSGKTTTLYTLLKTLNTKQVNITTIEDPVEYKIEGINQIQANQQTNLTFAKGLRSVARQDPNIILVGEIRDLETADIAVNAALTGHLLLSTFHASNAATAIPRFIDMGIEPFLVSSTLELVVAQRLVRRICDSCKVSYSPTKSEFAVYGATIARQMGADKITLYKGKGCPACNGSGYKGRIGVFEYIVMTPELQDLIAKHPATKEVDDLVKKQQFRTMFQDGLDKVRDGITTIDELLRVVAP